MSDTHKLDMIREVMPVTQNRVYLNAGSVGPISTITSQTMRHHDEIALREGRATMEAFMAFSDSKAELREQFAALTQASAEE
ncbi:MAG: hypothetical protein R3264_18385, partial [Anaerolineae bacterium]|nr:hypothetical protein [Anaerolineae bacterium]